MSDITKKTLSELVKNIKEKKLSSEEVTNSYIDRSKKSKDLNAYITENFSQAIDEAKKFALPLLTISDSVLSIQRELYIFW